MVQLHTYTVIWVLWVLNRVCTYMHATKEITATLCLAVYAHHGQNFTKFTIPPHTHEVVHVYMYTSFLYAWTQ